MWNHQLYDVFDVSMVSVLWCFKISQFLYKITFHTHKTADKIIVFLLKLFINLVSSL
jgi:hypothetical protein